MHRVQACCVNPQVFNFYFVIGVIVSCLGVYLGLLAFGEPVSFTYLGVISGFCLSVCGVTTFAAIQYIGLSVGVTIWSGTAILVSFAQGFLVGETATHLYVAIMGCVVLVAGVVGAGCSEKLVELCRASITSSSEEDKQALIPMPQSARGALVLQSF